MNDINNIGKLLEKYYRGETSSQEEKLLREYFEGKDIPEQFQADAELFGFFARGRELSLSGEMEERLNKQLKISGSSEPSRPSLLIQWRYYWMSGVAAVILIIVGIFLDLKIRKNSNLEVRKDTYEDPYIAYAEAKRVLYMVSEKMNTGRKPLQDLKKLDEGVNYMHPVFSFGAGIQHLESFSKIEETKKLISK